jgi:hypothetical protein
MNTSNSSTADRMVEAHGEQSWDSGGGSRFPVCGPFVLILLTAFSTNVVYPQDAAETTVVGQNDPTVDVQTVQEAVDHFDIVDLQGTFHFGDESTPYTPTDSRGGIRITRAGVTLRGGGKDATRIVGGGRPVTPEEWPFWPTPISVVGADAVKIHGLTLDGYMGFGIVVRGCQDFESIAVGIINGIPATDDWYRYGWYFGGMGAPGVTGDVLIQDCEYRSTGVTAHWEDAICAIYGANDAHFTIVNNIIEVGSRVGPEWMNDAIHVGATALIGNTARIEGNTVAAGGGILVHNIRGADIRNNHIAATHFGLLVATPEESQPYIVEKNSIHMEGGSAAMKCGGLGGPWATVMVVKENRLSGNADFGFLLEGSAQGNRFVIDENDMEGFTATTAHVSLGRDTRDNLFSLVDLADLVIVDQGETNAFEYPSAHVASATMTAALATGQPSPLEVTVVLGRPLEETETLRRMILDLSPLGLPSELPLEHVGDGRYTASTAVTPLRHGHHYLPILLETPEGERHPLITIPLDVYPGGDEYLYQDQMGARWEARVSSAGTLDPTGSDVVHRGSYAQAITLPNGILEYTHTEPDGLYTFGYTTLEFWIHPGTSSAEQATLVLMTSEGPHYLKLGYHLGITLEPGVWQVASISLEDLKLVDTHVEYIQLQGVVGSFYIDDMRFISEEVAITAVEEVSQATVLPLGYALAQNYPNPFNSSTMMRFDLPQSGEVELALYNLAGQQEATLVQGHREAGTHRLRWDGRDDDGRGLASGVYLYRLTAGKRVATRKLLLLR